METQDAIVVSLVDNHRFNIALPLIIKFENGKQFRATGTAGHKYSIGQSVVVRKNDNGGWVVTGETPRHMG